MPAEDIPQIDLFEGADKLVHFCMYLGFTWLVCWSLRSESKSVINYFVIILTVGWGILMEVLQLLMQFGRSFEWMDVLANSVGAITGVLIYNLMVTYKNNLKIH
jgi:VanZ family protein